MIDLKNVIYVDSTGAEALESLVAACRKHRVWLIVAGLVGQPHDIAARTGLLAAFTAQTPDDVQPTLSAAMQLATTRQGSSTPF